MKIPVKQSDILVKTYLKFVDYINNNKEAKESDIVKNTVLIFYDIDEVKFNTLPVIQINNMYQIIENILNTPQELVPTFNMNDIEYGIQPNFDTMTFGELVDLDTTDLMLQMSILYRPIVSKKKNKYLIEKYNADISTYDDFKEKLTLDIYNGFIGFFLNILKECMNYIQKSIATQADITPEQKKNLEESGLGLVGYMNLLTVTLPKRNLS